MNDNMKYAKIRVWLPVLMYCALASLINSVISYLPFIPASLTTWISRGIMLTMTVLGAFYLLTPVNVFLYQLIFMVPGLLTTEWTRAI
jgi:hypothetical protein